jgi:uncharacterized protein (DUF924 family)
MIATFAWRCSRNFLGVTVMNIVQRNTPTEPDHTDLKTAIGGVLAFWFGTLSQDSMPAENGEQMRRWYGKDPATDRDIRKRYSALYRKVAAALRAGWSPQALKDRLAVIIILDQFPRNMFRDTPGMYATDNLALELARASLSDPSTDGLDLYEAMFLFMPLMHSEQIQDQEVMLAKFRQLRDRATAGGLGCQPFFEMAETFAARHMEIVARFGRFPHRNAILSRQTTDAESRFLLESNSSF